MHARAHPTVQAAYTTLTGAYTLLVSFSPPSSSKSYPKLYENKNSLFEFTKVRYWSPSQLNLIHRLPMISYISWILLCKVLKTNILCTILCTSNQVLISTLTRLDIQWSHLQAVQYYCSFLSTHPYVYFIYATPKCLTATFISIFYMNVMLNSLVHFCEAAISPSDKINWSFFKGKCIEEF